MYATYIRLNYKKKKKEGSELKINFEGLILYQKKTFFFSQNFPTSYATIKLIILSLKIKRAKVREGGRRRKEWKRKIRENIWNLATFFRLRQTSFAFEFKICFWKRKTCLGIKRVRDTFLGAIERPINSLYFVDNHLWQKQRHGFFWESKTGSERKSRKKTKKKLGGKKFKGTRS